jgi:hypothetical protein
VIIPALTVAGSTSMSVDLPVAEVTGTVTVNGVPVPDTVSGGARGALTFDESSMGAVTASLGTSGAATYHIRVYQGTYRVAFSNATDCPSAAEGALPCQGDATVAASASLTGIGSLDFDLRVWSLSGTVTVNGAPMAASPAGATRGVLTFGVEPAGGPRSVSLGTTGAAVYQTRLLQGVYDIGFKNDQDCANGGGAVPCQQQVLKGCRVP